VIVDTSDLTATYRLSAALTRYGRRLRDLLLTALSSASVRRAGGSKKTGGNSEGGCMKFVAILCLAGGALAAVACADGPGIPTSPSAGVSASALAASSPRAGDLYVTKECSQNAGLPGQFCTITSSNVGAIEVGSRVIYLTARGPAGLDSDVILEPPGPGNNRAFGHCTLIAPVRQCTFSGGTGKFTHFQATVAVSLPLGGPGGPNFSWTGTYSFSPLD
jgi:hypothetical protein